MGEDGLYLLGRAGCWIVFFLFSFFAVCFALWMAVRGGGSQLGIIFFFDWVQGNFTPSTAGKPAPGGVPRIVSDLAMTLETRISPNSVPVLS